MQKFTCTACSYIYNPFIGEENTPSITAFEDLDESWNCPHCGEEKDNFIETPVSIQEVSQLKELTEQEASHIPFYKEQGDLIIIQIGTVDNPHEIEENHFIEYVGLFEIDGEIIELKLQPEEDIITFENPGYDEYEVRLSCNIHGVWRGMKI
ncbi:MAG: rubredoxin [Candidatus Gracilibacteria bacterium]